jgi:subtilisin family serine protease
MTRKLLRLYQQVPDFLQTEPTMTREPAGWRQNSPPSLVSEIDYIIKSFAELPAERSGGKGQGTRIGVASTDGEVDYLYDDQHILVLDSHLGRVLGILGYPADIELRPDPDGPVSPVIAGVLRVRLQPDGKTPPDVPGALARIDRVLGPGIATPDHVLTAASGQPSFCPATEPEPAYCGTEPVPGPCPGTGGGTALVFLADTGLLQNAADGHPWLAGVRADTQADFESYVPPASGAAPPFIPAYTGHGTFVAGVLRCVAPAADVVVARVSLTAGSTLESQLVMRLNSAFGEGADIYHVTVACPSRLDLPLIGFRAWLRQLREYGGAVCVAPAGNSGNRRPSWPAAFADVISVGALGADWRSRATFSNFGGWVDVYAPGRDLVNAYTTGTYQCHVPPYAPEQRTFYGMAKWSGTSFSTPVVSGLIAARMSRTGENARQAADSLLAQARAQAIPGLGPVLLPCCDCDHDACGHARCTGPGRGHPQDSC